MPYKSHSKRRTRRTRRTRRRKTRIKGGNYEYDVTTRTIEGFPSKPLNNITVTGPGFVLSGSAYLKRMEDRDRNGTDSYE